jgi:Ni,Fe-hydrogenase I cytochrome b subunit
VHEIQQQGPTIIVMIYKIIAKNPAAGSIHNPFIQTGAQAYAVLIVVEKIPQALSLFGRDDLLLEIGALCVFGVA